MNTYQEKGPRIRAVSAEKVTFETTDKELNLMYKSAETRLSSKTQQQQYTISHGYTGQCEGRVDCY